MSFSIDPVTRAPDASAASALSARMRGAVFLNLVAAAANQGSTLLVNLIVANLLGPFVFGRYVMVLTTLTTLAALAQLSMGYTATKHVAEFRAAEPGRTARILTMCALVSAGAGAAAALLLVAAGGWLAGTVLGAPDLAPALRLAAPAVFFNVLTGFATGALAGLERYRSLAIVGVASGALYVSICVPLAARLGLRGAVAGLALTAAAQAALLAWSLGRDGRRLGLRWSARGAWAERAILSGFALPASLTGLVSLPALWIASAILARSPGGYEQLALFGAANLFRTMVLFVPQAINNVGMSLLNNQRRTSAEGFRRVFWLNAALTAAAALVTAAMLTLAGRPLLRLFGPTFDSAYRALVILLAAAVIEALAVALYQIVVSRGMLWASLMFVSVPRDLALVVAALVLSPVLGAAGLATAYALAWLLALASIGALVYRVGGTAATTAAAPVP